MNTPQTNTTQSEQVCIGTHCLHIPTSVKGDIIVSALATSVLINLAVFVTWLVITVS